MAIYASSNFHAKTSELIVYIAHRLSNKKNFGYTLLYKSLYLIDCTCYLKTGHPVSGLTYIKQEYGPTPTPGKFLPIRDVLIKRGEIEIVPVSFFGKKVDKFIAKRKPDITVFTKEEIGLINEVIDSISDMTAADLTAFTHEIPAWKAAELKEELPLYSYLLTHKEPSENDRKWATKIVKAYIKKENTSK